MNSSTRNLILALIGIGVLILVVARISDHSSRTPSSAHSEHEISWMTALEPALAKAKETGQPVMIDFFATWCPPCKKLDAETYTDSRVIQASKDWIMVRIDVDRNKALARKYQISSIPTIVLLQPDGTETGRHSGFMGPGPMLSLMEQRGDGMI